MATVGISLVLSLDLDSDGPDESEQLAAHGGGHLLPDLALGAEAPVARAQPVLGFPGDF
jgi:hypothetical protein